MDRRELLKMIAVLTGGVVIGGEVFLTGCKTAGKADAFHPSGSAHPPSHSNPDYAARRAVACDSAETFEPECECSGIVCNARTPADTKRRRYDES